MAALFSIFFLAVIAELELELELIQSHMTQKPMLRGEVGARALRDREGKGKCSSASGAP
jgi:hypothetical protein